MWPQSYEELLLEWKSLREDAATKPLDEALTLIHNWWNAAPIVGETIHFNDPVNWPLPWDLLAQPAYCNTAKCLGMAYTVIIINPDEIQAMYLLQTAANTYFQIKTPDQEYILSDDVGIITSDIDGNVLHQINCNFLKDKL